MKRGFTLIELLVVISIISLLSSVILTSVSEARKRAEYQKFGSELVQIRNALALYATDHGGDYGVGDGAEPLEGTIGRLYDENYLPSEILLPEYLSPRIFIPHTFSGSDSYKCGGVGDSILQLSGSGYIIMTRSSSVNLKDELSWG